MSIFCALLGFVFLSLPEGQFRFGATFIASPVAAIQRETIEKGSVLSFYGLRDIDIVVSISMGRAGDG